MVAHTPTQTEQNERQSEPHTTSTNGLHTCWVVLYYCLLSCTIINRTSQVCILLKQRHISVTDRSEKRTQQERGSKGKRSRPRHARPHLLFCCCSPVGGLSGCVRLFVQTCIFVNSNALSRSLVDSVIGIIIRIGVWVHCPPVPGAAVQVKPTVLHACERQQHGKPSRSFIFYIFFVF